MTNPFHPKSITLYNTTGSSDKVYQLSLRAVGDLWQVEYGNGRRGKPLKTGLKTALPISYEAALAVYEGVVKEKLKGGYTACESGVPYVGTEDAGRDSGLRPMLPVPCDDVELLLASPDWAMQRKWDGEFRKVIRGDDGAQGVNRKGLFVGLPEGVAATLMRVLPPDSVVDGEACGDTFIAFDLVRLGGEDLRDRMLAERSRLLEDALAGLTLARDGVTVATVTLLPHDKRAAFAALEAAHHEGAVFKELTGRYVEGKNGASIKYKFTDSATFIVASANQQRSVALEVLNNGVRQPVGNVTIPANATVPAVGSLVEVRFLYWFEGGALEQPVYLGERRDLDESDATAAQFRRIKRKLAPA